MERRPGAYLRAHKLAYFVAKRPMTQRWDDSAG